MKAYFEAEFNPEMMCEQECVDKDFGGDWNACMRLLIAEEGIGVFDEIKFLRCE